MTTDGGLSRIFQKGLPKWDWQPIETMTGIGVPDLNFCDGVEGWIELKSADHWKLNHKVTAGQVAWIERRCRAGGKVSIAVRRAKSELWLFNVRATRHLMTGRVDTSPGLLTTQYGGPAKWDWDRIASELKESI